MSSIDPVSAPSSDIVGDWADKESQHRANVEAIRPANKAALFDALASAGITTVLVKFDGYGDSGQVESIEAKIGENAVDFPDATIEIAQSHWGSSNVERSALAIRDAVEQLAYDFLGDTHCGWQDNDGAYGEFTIDVAERTITLDYNERISEAIYSQHVF